MQLKLWNVRVSAVRKSWYLRGPFFTRCWMKAGPELLTSSPLRFSSSCVPLPLNTVFVAAEVSRLTLGLHFRNVSSAVFDERRATAPPQPSRRVLATLVRARFPFYPDRVSARARVHVPLCARPRPLTGTLTSAPPARLHNTSTPSHVCGRPLNVTGQ